MVNKRDYFVYSRGLVPGSIFFEFTIMNSEIRSKNHWSTLMEKYSCGARNTCKPKGQKSKVLHNNYKTSVHRVYPTAITYLFPINGKLVSGQWQYVITEWLKYRKHNGFKREVGVKFWLCYSLTRCLLLDTDYCFSWYLSGANFMWVWACLLFRNKTKQNMVPALMEPELIFSSINSAIMSTTFSQGYCVDRCNECANNYRWWSVVIIHHQEPNISSLNKCQYSLWRLWW